MAISPTGPKAPPAVPTTARAPVDTQPGPVGGTTAPAPAQRTVIPSDLHLTPAASKGPSLGGEVVAWNVGALASTATARFGQLTIDSPRCAEIADKAGVSKEKLLEVLAAITFVLNEPREDKHDPAKCKVDDRYSLLDG